MTNTKQTIEIDCPPGYPRPGDLISGVIKGTGLPERTNDSCCFGNWEWDYSDIPKDVWGKAKPIIKERLVKLYNAGIARYCSW